VSKNVDQTYNNILIYKLYIIVMSNTGFKTFQGYDLADIFATGLPAGDTCGYRNSSGLDLCRVFKGGDSGLVTGYTSLLTSKDLGAMFAVYVPVIRVGGTPITPNVSARTYTFYLKSNNYFTIDKNVNINYTLVSGGGGPGTAVSSRPGIGGGGGHVLNCYGDPYTANTQLFATIGIGGTAIGNDTHQLNITGIPEMNTKLSSGSYSGTVLNTTNFTVYGGGSGATTSGINYPGQYGTGSNGGIYSGTLDNTLVVPGSGGGGLTTITITNGVGATLQTRGNAGGNATSTSSGNGGAGQTGIDGIIYGGGGGSAFRTTTGTNNGGLGGFGGGQNGSYASGSRTTLTGAYRINSTTTTTTLTGALGEQGGAVGGVFTDNITYFNVSPTNIRVPSAGIAIVQFTYP